MSIHYLLSAGRAHLPEKKDKKKMSSLILKSRTVPSSPNLRRAPISLFPSGDNNPEHHVQPPDRPPSPRAPRPHPRPMSSTIKVFPVRHPPWRAVTRRGGLQRRRRTVQHQSPYRRSACSSCRPRQTWQQPDGEKSEHDQGVVCGRRGDITTARCRVCTQTKSGRGGGTMSVG